VPGIGVTIMRMGAVFIPVPAPPAVLAPMVPAVPVPTMQVAVPMVGTLTTK
jgi:hypothetical protein